jgi:hypothetical protein
LCGGLYGVIKRIRDIFIENNESDVREHIPVGRVFSVIDTPSQGQGLKAEITVAAESIAKETPVEFEEDAFFLPMALVTQELQTGYFSM